jgi:hypothetical protein
MLLRSQFQVQAHLVFEIRVKPPPMKQHAYSAPKLVCLTHGSFPQAV